METLDVTEDFGDTTTGIYHIDFPQKIDKKQYLQLNNEERQKYIDSFYGNDKKHKVYAQVNIIQENYIELNAKYFLREDGFAIEFAPFDDKEYYKIGIGLSKFRRNGYETISDFEKKCNIHKGEWVVCNLEIVKEQEEIKKKHYFTTSINSIDKNVDLLERYCQDYGILNLCVNYQQDANGAPQFNSGIVMGHLRKQLDEQKAEIEQKKAELEQLNLRRDSLETEISDEWQQRMARLEQELSTHKQEIEEATAREIADAQKSLTELRHEIEKQKRKQAFLKAYHVPIDKLLEPIIVDDESQKNQYEADNFQEAIKYLQDHLHNEHHLDYSEDILRNIYLGLETEQLLLLVGRPGTGKTSLVRYLAKSFGFADAAIIPVQSVWSDKSDLIGYYNPLEKTYSATPFLDKLLEFCQAAKQHPEKMYFICLDEMNLAHVEHYFAEFLSILQERDPQKRILRLYSSTLRMDMARELRMNAFLDENGQPTVIYDKDKLSESSVSERKYFLELCRQAGMFAHYPDILEIPRNVKFFGTLNQDETTLDLSPKVLDRSYIIRLQHQPRIEPTNIDTELPLTYKPLKEYNPIVNDDFSKPLESIMEQINRVIDGGLSRRVTAFMESDDFSTWENVIGRRAIWDCLVASLVLPRIRYDQRADTDWDVHIDNLKSLCRDLPMSNGILQSISSKNEDELDFWRS